MNALTVNLRRLWPKYDTQLNQTITGMNLLLKMFEHFFEESKLEGDHDQFVNQEQGSIEELIYRNCGITAAQL